MKARDWSNTIKMVCSNPHLSSHLYINIRTALPAGFGPEEVLKEIWYVLTGAKYLIHAVCQLRRCYECFTGAEDFHPRAAHS